MKTETDVLIKISELEMWVSHVKKENPIEGNDSIIIANEKIKILNWVLEK